MAYKVIRNFADTTDKTVDYPNGFLYEIGQSYPRHEKEVSQERVAELSSMNNSAGAIFIADDSVIEVATEIEVEELPTTEDEKPKRTRKKKVEE